MPLKINGKNYIPKIGNKGIAKAYVGSQLVYEISGGGSVSWSDGATKLPALSALPSTGRGVSFSPDGTYLAYAHQNSPFATVYKRSGDTFTKLPALSALPNTGLGVSFSSCGTYVAYAHAGSPFATVYKGGGE